ncbi:MAG: rhomboid family intramembrane serine protease [Bacteroidota bacterium]
MVVSVLLILIGITSLISYNGFNDQRISQKLAFSPYLIVHHKEWHRMISHVLIHADFTHLLFNMMSLYFLGTALENSLILQYGVQLGEIHFLLIYILGGIFAGAYPLFKHRDNPNYQAVGASGAVAAVIFACIIWNPGMELLLFMIPIPIPAYIFGPVYLAIEYFQHRRGGTGVAHDAHIGGAIFGIIYILFINIEKGTHFLDNL